MSALLESHARGITLLAMVAGLLSASCSGFGMYWLLIPDAHPWADVDPRRIDLVGRLPTTLTAGLIMTLGLFGVLAVMARLLIGQRARPTLFAAGGLQMLGNTLLSSVAALTLLAYLVALVIPAAGIVLLVLACRRVALMRYLTAMIVIAVAAWGTVTAALKPSHLLRLLQDVADRVSGLPAAASVPMLIAATTTCWLFLIMRDGAFPITGPVADQIARWSRPVTWIAAACPLPYGLQRLTWLTPLPSFGLHGEILDPETRLWGLLLGGGALIGCVLTLGLISRWGRTFPSWTPRIAGQPVPVSLAVVPGLVVAISVTITAIPMAMMSASTGGWWNLILPFWLWGPALALAVWGYAVRRRALQATVPS
ncbi:hypothetical protein [Actinopolymorpha alba]|uniref:hypothetical protein n=1 Tax=Actinopolymorpha alba TaxID=533267 RepID=UPI00037D2573|nr:hypothetical protein [Actinopolymorpha alba]